MNDDGLGKRVEAVRSGRILRIDRETDPFIQRGYRQYVQISHLQAAKRGILPYSADFYKNFALIMKDVDEELRSVYAPWNVEADRRLHSFLRPDQFPYYTDEQTWDWEGQMIETLNQLKGDVSKATLNPDGPGFGVHIFRLGRIGGKENLYLPISNDETVYVSVMRIERSGRISILGRNDATDRMVGKEFSHGRIQRDIQENVPGAMESGTKKIAELCNIYENVPGALEVAVKMQAVLSTSAVVTKDEKAPREFRRYAKNVEKQDMEASVRTVYWRKREYQPGETEGEHTGQTRGFHHVRGHFRQQWYATAGEHRAIYIHDHYRGSGPVKDPRMTVNVVKE